MKKQGLLCILLLIIFNIYSQNIEFYENLVEDFIDGPTSCFVCDLDNDGDNDILASCNDENAMCWWSNEGGEPIVWEFHHIDNFLGAIYVFAEDIDGDENIDVLGAGWDSNEIAWWRNDGNDPIGWTKQTLADDFNFVHEVYAADIDLDGNMDILGAAAQNNEIAWWKNNGGNPIQWTKQSIDLEFAGARSIDVADINDDGFNDVVGAALTDNEVAWWENSGEQPINWTKHTVADDFIMSHKVYICDFNNDDHPDILGTAYSSKIYWWENDGNDPVGWNEHQIATNFGGAVIAYANDLDNDNDLDVFGSAQGSNQVAWWENDGNYPFEWDIHQIVTNFEDAWGLHFGDIDGDEDIDIVVGGTEENEIRWFENSYYNVSFSATPLTGHFPLEVDFFDESNFNATILEWFWDFDNDGSIDSNEQNPTFTYEEHGTYSVNLMIMTESFSKSVVYENYIQVFNGESALSFDGNGYAMCDAAESLNFSNEFTFEAWINPTGYGTTSDIGFGRIFDKEKLSLYMIGSSPMFNDQSLIFEFQNEEGLIFKCNTPENSILLDNNWKHIAVSYGATDGVKIYISGCEQELTYSTEPYGFFVDNLESDFIIGSSLNLSWKYQGIIDEVRLWNHAKNGSEIMGMMFNHLSGSEENLVLCWEMQEGANNFLSDNTSYQNTGTINNGNWIQGIDLIPSSINENIIIQQDKIQMTAYPNPFNPSVTISFQISNEQNQQNKQVELEIYNIKGQIIKAFQNLQIIKSPNQHIIWNGKDNQNNDVSSGIYFYNLKINQESVATKRMILIK
ncbi:MAG: FG-GAP-like repeat-containing protein [Candidatus Cloacimonetes bacterium]|nr:FG-GAP-like repeat-containing protein [Candidatus Cloacimonadota bacterium]